MLTDSITLLDGAIERGVIEGGLSFPPSPRAGQLFYLTQTPLGLYVFDGGQWGLVNTGATYSLPIASSSVLGGIMVGSSFTIDGSGVLSLSAQPYDMPIFYKGIPGTSELMARIGIVRTITLPINLTGSIATSEVAATLSTTLTIKHWDGASLTSIGTVTFSAGSSNGTFTFSSAVTLAPGNRLYLYNQATADATLADISITLMGTR